MDATGSDIQWVMPLIQLAQAGGFAALTWYIIVKHIPAIEQRHSTERKEWLQYIQKRDDDYDQVSQRTVEHHTRIEAKLEQFQESIDKLSEK